MNEYITFYMNYSNELTLKKKKYLFLNDKHSLIIMNYIFIIILFNYLIYNYIELNKLSKLYIIYIIL